MRDSISEDDVTLFRVPLGDPAVARLLALSKAVGKDPRAVAGSLLEHMLADDAAANGELERELLGASQH